MVRSDKFKCTPSMKYNIAFSLSHTSVHVCRHTHTLFSLHILILHRIKDKSIPKNIFFCILLKERQIGNTQTSVQ